VAGNVRYGLIGGGRSTGRKIWRALVVCRTAPTSRCVSRGYGCWRDPNWGFVLRSHQHRTGAETRWRNLRRIPPPKSECVRRTWIPTTYLLASRSALPFVQQAGKAELMQWLLY